MSSETARLSRLRGGALFAAWMLVLLAASPVLHFAADAGYRRAAIGAIGFVSAALGTFGVVQSKLVEGLVVFGVGGVIVVLLVLAHRAIDARRA